MYCKAQNWSTFLPACQGIAVDLFRKDGGEEEKVKSRVRPPTEDALLPARQLPK